MLTDAAFAHAALQARQRDGRAWAWVLSQLPSARQFPAELLRSLTQQLDGIQSASAALLFIQDITTGLATLQALAARLQDTERQQAWQQACQQLLPAMVKHFATLVRNKPEADHHGWEPLAQWVWVTDAAMGLTPGDALSHADCLSVLHQRHARLTATLSLVCPAQALCSTASSEAITPKHIQALFAACPLGTRQALLQRLPVLALWMRTPRTLGIREFLADNALPPEQQALQLMALIDAGIAMAHLPEVLAGLLDTATLTHRLANRQPDKKDGWWLVHALRGWLDRVSAARQMQRPRALPNLLDLFRRITLNANPTQRQTLWPVWRTFVADCAALRQPSDLGPRPMLEASDWVLLGRYLPLDPEPGEMERQIRELDRTSAGGPILVQLLQGWLAQRFAEAFDAAPEAYSTAQRQQFQAAWALTKGLMQKLSPEERKAMGIEVKPALKDLARQYEHLLIKKS